MGTRRLQTLALVFCVAAPGVAHARPPAKSSSVRPLNAAGGQGKHTRNLSRKNWRKRGQQAMNTDRVRKIQAALIRENYLKGRPSGAWDQRSKDAMARFQADNRWQSKVVPDSRALIKLGLGPAYTGLLNPETAVLSFISGPEPGPRSGPSQR